MREKAETQKLACRWQLTAGQKRYFHVKCVLDRILGVLGLILLSPVFLVIVVAVKIEDGFRAPVIFRQKRVGIHGTYFQLLKFRSMKLDTPHDCPTHLLKNPDQYITRIGRFLRKTSLDELPQLWNIAAGSLSVVGPRPALWNQEDLIALREEYGVQQVKPGLTGLAQISGRDELEIEEKALLDRTYVEHLGFRMDVRCFFGTFLAVLRSDGVVEGGTGAMEAEKKGKILILTNHSYMMYQFRRELILELQQKYEVVLSMPFVGHEEDFRKMGCKCINTKIDRRGINPVTDLKLLQFYNKIIAEEKPDKVITYSIKPNIYAGLICRHKKIPYYANVQGLGTAFQKKLLTKFVGILYKTAFRKVRAVFFENQGNAQEFISRKLVAEDKIIVLNGAGINLEHYAYTPISSRQEENDNSSAGEQKMHFLYVGRIMKEKGIDELFTAMRRLHGEYGDKVILDIVGFFEDEYKDAVEKLVEDGIAVFHGFQVETRPYYVMADCIVLPSWHEGMSNVLLEASAIGRPVITSDIPGCREAVEDGKTGYLCEVRNAEMLFEKMKLMADQSAEEIEEMGRCARKRMEELFDKKKVVEQTVEIISGK